MRAGRRRIIGRVVSDAMLQTVVVQVESIQRHRLYKKTLRTKKKYKAHDAENSAKVGDLVRIVESRPLSKEVRWVVEEILERGTGIAPPAVEEMAG
ncbi:MAG: 30S ribosomal protein S17 [Chloroflexi bacterium]|nr:30S ribosomal protein S17 [Chloroflexota bacterium]